MADGDLAAYRQQIVEACAVLAQAGVLSASGHGNFSVRIPGTDTMLLTAQSNLGHTVRPESLALLSLDGTLLDGSIDPASAEIVFMHAIVYQRRPEVGAVVHTHSPYATSFAVASQPLPVIYEAQVRFGMTDGVPVAGYGPRGSDQSVENIAHELARFQHIRGVLLENHGVLAFSADAAAAARAVIVIEETAQLALHARALGGAKPIPPEMYTATQERQAEYAQRGTQSAS